LAGNTYGHNADGNIYQRFLGDPARYTGAEGVLGTSKRAENEV
jgi:hypothetical protein